MKWKLITAGVLVFIIILITILLFIPPKLKLENENVNINTKSYIPEYTINKFGKDFTKKAKVKGKVNTKKIGTYNLTFKTKTGFMSFIQTKKVKVKDFEYPILKLKGETETYYCPGTEYTDEGAIAIDNKDGDLTKKIKIKKEKKKIIYFVKDKAGNITKKTRKLKQGDKTPPKMTLNGSENMTLYVGDKYTEPGVTVIDNCDGDISDKVVTSGQVDTAKLGTYTITYSILDKNNNKTEITRNIKIISRPKANGTGKAGTIYLTFDDGPLQGTTNIILDILKEEGVKATFFVTKNGPDELIKREYEEGHTVALHTWSHDYQACYSSVDGYFNDLNQISGRVKNITGEDAKIIRFPGGASNTVSRKYSPGIMSTLTREVEARGYVYFDWNISSGDAGATTDPNGVYSNVVNNLSKNRANIVLMHDIKTYTRDAIRNIIKFGKDNGYAFDRITVATEPYHQNVNN